MTGPSKGRGVWDEPYPSMNACERARRVCRRNVLVKPLGYERASTDTRVVGPSCLVECYYGVCLLPLTPCCGS